jgi:hypothetical protein
MKKPSPETTVALLTAVALHVVLIVLIIRFGSIKPKPHSGPMAVVQMEGASGAVGGVGAPSFAASGVPYESVAICVYSQVAERIQLDTMTTPKNNPSFMKCPATIPQVSSAQKKVSGVFKFSFRHRRTDGFSVVESTGDSRTDSIIVASVLRQGFWTSNRHVFQPERIAYIVKFSN